MVAYWAEILGVRRRAMRGPRYFWKRPRGMRSPSAWGVSGVERGGGEGGYKESGEEVVDFGDGAGAAHV